MNLSQNRIKKKKKAKIKFFNSNKLKIANYLLKKLNKI